MFDLLQHEARLDRVQQLLAQRDQIDRDLAAAVGEADHHHSWVAAGSRNARRFLRTHGQQSPEASHIVLRRARLLRHHPATASAVAAGALSMGALDALASAVTDARTFVYRRDEQLLLGHAAALPLDDLHRALAHWGDLADHLDEHDLDQFRQHLAVQRRFDGGADLRGSLDELTAQSVIAALDAFDPGPDPADDPCPRSAAQRRADALGDIAGAALAAGTGPISRERRPLTQTDLVIDLATVESLMSGEVIASPAATAELDGRPICAAAALALACSSRAATLVVDQRGTVVSASERAAPFSARERRAIASRDRRCVFPGCDQTPSRCDAHHLVFRRHGGTNDLANGVLLCRRHHRLVHAGWHLHRQTDSGTWSVTSPTGRAWNARPAPPADRASTELDAEPHAPVSDTG